MKINGNRVLIHDQWVCSIIGLQDEFDQNRILESISYLVAQGFRPGL
jgi:hypothetical protein